MFTLKHRRSLHLLRGFVANRTPALAVTLAVVVLLDGCQSAMNRKSDLPVDASVDEEVSESQAQELPLPSVDGQKSPNPAPETQNVFSGTHIYSPLSPDENRDCFTAEKAQDQVSNPGFVPRGLSFSHSIWQKEPNEWTTSAKVCDMSPPNSICTDSQTSSSGVLWNIGCNTTYRHLLENGWIDGVSVSVESDSQKPFSRFSQVNEGMIAFVQVPQGQHDFWLFSLSYSSSNKGSLPTPEVEYAWQPSNRLQANISLISPVMDHLSNGLSLNVSVKLLGRVKP